MSSESKAKQNKKTDNKPTIKSEPTEYKDFDVETKIYYKVAILLHKCGIDYNENKEVIKSFIEKLKGLFGSGATHHQLEALEFILAGKPKDMIEIHHLLNLFITSDYMRICRLYMYSNTATHEQNQEYIRLSGKIMEQYSKGMLSLKMYREGIPQIQNNKIQNNTLNQLNIHAQKEEKEQPKEAIETAGSQVKLAKNTIASEYKESVKAGKVVIKEKGEV